MQIEFNINFLKIIGYSFLIIIIFLVLYFFYKKIIRFLKRPELYGLDKQGIEKRWQEIENLLEKRNEMSYKLAIMEADKLLDHVLKSMAMPGKDLGERLKAACYKYPNLRQVWFAHKIRNQIVHEASYRLSSGLANKAIKSFKQAFKELNVL